VAAAPGRRAPHPCSAPIRPTSCTPAAWDRQVAKAVNNLILGLLVADHEGLALAQRYGADVEALRRALLMSSCANGPLEKWAARRGLAEDDMAIVAEMAAEAGIALPQAGVNREIARAKAAAP